VAKRGICGGSRLRFWSITSKDAGRARALRGGFERTVGSRLCGSFWTLRENEVAEVIALIESGDRVT